MNKDYAEGRFVKYDPWDDNDKSPNDYRGAGDKLTEYPHPAMSKEEFAEYLNERLEDCELDNLPF